MTYLYLFVYLKMPLEFIKSNKVRDFLLTDGFTFRLEKTVEMKKR